MRFYFLRRVRDGFWMQGIVFFLYLSRQAVF